VRISLHLRGGWFRGVIDLQSLSDNDIKYCRRLLVAIATGACSLVGEMPWPRMKGHLCSPLRTRLQERVCVDHLRQAAAQRDRCAMMASLWSMCVPREIQWQPVIRAIYSYCAAENIVQNVLHGQFSQWSRVKFSPAVAERVLFVVTFWSSDRNTPAQALFDDKMP